MSEHLSNLHALAPPQDASADSEASARGVCAWSEVGVSAAARELPEARASQPGSGSGAGEVAGWVRPRIRMDRRVWVCVSKRWLTDCELLALCMGHGYTRGEAYDDWKKQMEGKE